MLGLSGVESFLINPQRDGRREPRLICRSLKEYNLMKRPRAELKRTEEWAKTVSRMEFVDVTFSVSVTFPVSCVYGVRAHGSTNISYS